MQMHDAKKKAIEELMAHLDQKDGDDLGSAMKPKEEIIEAPEMEKAEGMEPDGDEAPKVEIETAQGAEPKMSPEEMEELIEAIQSKLGA